MEKADVVAMRLLADCAWRVVGLMVVVAGTPALGLSAQAPRRTATIAAQAIPATVTIVTLDAVGDTLGQGSGFFIRPDGTLLTNWHVMDGAHHALVRLASGERYERVTFLSGDSVADIVVLKIPGHQLPVLPTRSTIPLPGERVVVIGSPLGLSRTVTEGIVSARRLVNGRELVQLSAAISPGSSGGPVLDGQGRVFAVAVGTLEEGQQLNFAVPVRYALGLLGEAQEAQPLAAVFEPPLMRIRLRLVRDRVDDVISVVYAVPRRGFADALYAACSELDPALEAVALRRRARLPDPADSVILMRAERAARTLVGRLFRAVQQLATDSARLSAGDRFEPLSVPDGGAVLGVLRGRRASAVVQLPFEQAVAEEQPVAISELRRYLDLCYDGLLP